MIKEFNSSKTSPLVLFLGLDERSKDKEGFKHGIYSGIPYFAIDVTPKGTYENEANSVVKAMQEKGLVFQEGRMLMSLDAQEAAIFAQARALLDWNARNPFCGGCGQPTLSVSSLYLEMEKKKSPVWDITKTNKITGQRRYQTRLSPHRFRLSPHRPSRNQPRNPHPKSLLRNAQRRIQSLFPTDRSHRHHGGRQPRRQTRSPRPSKALATILVQRAGRVLRARRIRRGSRASRSLGGVRRETRSRCHS